MIRLALKLLAIVLCIAFGFMVVSPPAQTQVQTEDWNEDQCKIGAQACLLAIIFAEVYCVCPDADADVCDLLRNTAALICAIVAKNC